MAHERCVETVSAVSDQFNRRFCTSLGEAHMVVAAGHGHFGGLESAPAHLGSPQQHLSHPYHTWGGWDRRVECWTRPLGAPQLHKNG